LIYTVDSTVSAAADRRPSVIIGNAKITVDGILDKVRLGAPIASLNNVELRGIGGRIRQLRIAEAPSGEEVAVVTELDVLVVTAIPSGGVISATTIAPA
jgi:hypothetical protein